MVKGLTEISKHVLTVAPQFKNHRGGIGAVIASYAIHIRDFKFVATYDGRYGVIRNIAFFVLSLLRVTWKLSTDRSIKIVHIHGASKGSFLRKYLIFLMAKFLFRKKVIYHLHGGKFHLFYENSNFIIRFLIRHLSECVDVFICLSTYWQIYLSKEFDIRNLTVVNNPVSLAPRPYHIYEDSKEEILNMLFLGRIGDTKGIFDLLDVIKTYRQEWEGKIKLKIGGDGEVNRLKNYIETHCLSSIVEYIGWADGDKKHELLSRCNVLVLPSYNEGLPISILEAMSYGKGIISTTVGGIPEVVKHQENGFLITPGDFDGLAEAIDRLVQSPQLRKAIGETSKRRVEPYLIENVLIQLNSIYSYESMD